ncbi:MAG TPA: hypothetical protein VM597_18990 [Gemmataceae bacterium]|nr:hypothetical protein [Gemmataceae bacterium]
MVTRAFLLVPVLASGCAYLAVKPPTPAAAVRAGDLEAGTPEGDRYFILVFGSQSVPKVPRRTHTWATVVRVTGTEAEADTISWMPATLEIRPWRFRVEPGVNLGLTASVEWALADGQRVSAWGPYELRPGVYAKFRMQMAFLETGRVGYQCIDSTGEAGRTGRGCDCIHAVTDLDSEYDRRHYRLDRYGEAASRFIVRQLAERGALVDAGVTHDWLLAALGLDRYPIRRMAGPAPPPAAAPAGPDF